MIPIRNIFMILSVCNFVNLEWSLHGIVWILFGKQVLNQDETPLLYSLVFGEGVVNDATSVVLFNALQNFDLNLIDVAVVLKFLGNFCYLFLSSTFLGVFVSLILKSHLYTVLITEEIEVTFLLSLAGWIAQCLHN